MQRGRFSRAMLAGWPRAERYVLVDLWRQQVAAFVKERMGDEPPIVIGHSFGSLIALELAAELAAAGTPVRAVGMMNCGVGMNNNNALKVEEWRTGARGACASVLRA